MLLEKCFTVKNVHELYHKTASKAIK